MSPPPSSHGTSWELSDGQESWPSHGYRRAHPIPPRTHQPTAQPGSSAKPQHPQLGRTPPKPPNLGPDIRRVCKWPAISKKRKAWKKFVSKRTHDRHPWAVLHLHSTPVYHLWHKVVKGHLSWAEPAVSSLPCCSTEVENTYYCSHKVLTIMVANPVISIDVGKLLTSLSLLLTMQKNLGFSPQLNKTCGELAQGFHSL